MELSTALLCDFAQVREGLLFVSSGGVTMLNRSEWPAPMAVHLALVFDLHPTEALRPHELQIIVQSADGERVAEVTGGLQVNPDAVAAVPVGGRISIPFALNLTAVKLENPGRYSLEILIDANHVRSIDFSAHDVQGEEDTVVDHG
jgi:hypothetical protein